MATRVGLENHAKRSIRARYPDARARVLLLIDKKSTFGATG